MEFEQAIDCGPPQLKSQWTFWMCMNEYETFESENFLILAVLYCATIYTTVG